MSVLAESANPRGPRVAVRRLLWTLLVLTVLLAIVGGVIAWKGDELVTRRLRPATIDLLQQRFDSQVELGRFDVRMWPAVHVRGEGLVLRHQGRRDIPPLLSIASFTIEGGWRELWNRRIDRLHLEGLEIVIPPQRGRALPDLDGHRAPGSGKPDVLIRELVSDSGKLTIMARRAGKSAREFQLTHIRFEQLQFERPSPFEAVITNPIPRGEIHTVGTFGPWWGPEPAATPINGTFRFDADLGTIEGISGDLHAEGEFAGPLEQIRTRGKTFTEHFRLSTGGAEFPLTTEYVAVVDGTSGDTFLESVEADVGQSHVSAKGAVVGVEGVRGRRVKLETRAKGARLEDFIRLTTRVKTSPMVGRVDVVASMDLPPGSGEVLDRLDLSGTFNVASARFTSEAVQQRLDELSRRGRGRPDDESIDNVASNMRGVFHLQRGRMTLRSLTFGVNGAEVRMAGNYDARSERLDFRGTLRLEAAVSKTQTGWKSIVLKVFDPLFRRDGAGTVLPITITGTRNQPKFGVEIRKAILRKP